MDRVVSRKALLPLMDGGCLHVVRGEGGVLVLLRSGSDLHESAKHSADSSFGFRVEGLGVKVQA
jgi:hypothetical protein